MGVPSGTVAAWADGWASATVAAATARAAAPDASMRNDIGSLSRTCTTCCGVRRYEIITHKVRLT
ncbi:hypothetical protein GCM10010278_03500 [Streptomyces melanogenes]|nr:hypothetical protein GCM10010278_03500 [Streptomyces melanogenes]